jgi:hypothetical protein
MEDGHKCSQREGGKLPRARLMAPSMTNCRGMTIGMGGSCAVLSSPQIILQLNHGIHHSTSSLYLFALLGDLTMVLSKFSGLILRLLWPPGSIMPRERERETQAGTLLVLLCCKVEMPIQFGEGFIYIPYTANPTMPPMAFVEEEIPEEPIQVPPKSLLYTVLDAQDNPNKIRIQQ